MKLSFKKNSVAVITLIILCIVQVTCVALTKVPADTRDEVSSESTTVEQVVTTETYTEEVTEIETTTETTTCIPETTTNKADNNKDVTTNHVTTDIDTPSKQSYTEDDLFYLAAAVCYEAGGEPEETQLLVANVIINRVNSSLYPNTIYGVLTQPYQYGTLRRDGVHFPSWADKDVKTQCYNVARRVLNGERFCPANVLFQAEFVQGSGVYKKINNMYFCYY